MTAAELIVSALIAQDDGTPRTAQKSLGPSDLMGCRAKAWLKVNNATVCNPDALRLPAILGTAVHLHMDRALKRLDPWGEKYRTEVEVERDGLTGHVDLIIGREVIDLKTLTKKNKRYFPKPEQRAQVQVYGWLLGGAEAVDTVTLVGIVRDGSELDVVQHSEPYSERIALLALEWKAEVESATEQPEPERPAKVFCQPYCQFYGSTCPGKAS